MIKELYDFSLKNFDGSVETHWRYTSTARDIVPVGTWVSDGDPSRGSGGASIDGDFVAGASSIDVDGLTPAATIKEGDLFFIRSGFGIYRVTGDTVADGGGAATIAIDPVVPTDGFGDDALVDLPTWTALAGLKRTEFKRDLRDTKFSVTMPLDVSPADLFLNTNPAQLVSVDIFNQNAALILTGRILRAKFNSKKGQVTFDATAFGEIHRGDIPRARFSRYCPFDLGDAKCSVDLTAFDISVPAAALAGDGLSATHANIGGEANGYWSQGYASSGDSDVFIVIHSGDKITFLTPILNPAATIAIFPGCAKTPSECRDKFANIENFGGYWLVPQDKPYRSFSEI